MLKHGGFSSLLSTSKPFAPVFFNKTSSCCASETASLRIRNLIKQGQKLGCVRCSARRRLRYEEDEEENDYGYNPDIALLESYSESATNEALLVRAMVNGQEEEVLIFKGFSSCLSYSTSPNPSRSILPARATITSIDRIIGPFDPSNIEYIERGLTWDNFKKRLQPNQR